MSVAERGERVLSIDSTNASTRLWIVGGVPLGNGGVEPNPAISNATICRVGERYDVTAFHAACDMPMPCSRISGRRRHDRQDRERDAADEGHDRGGIAVRRRFRTPAGAVATCERPAHIYCLA
jgi:hypothetical protein